MMYESYNLISQVTGLQMLPVEILREIKLELQDLSSHVVYSQLCRSTRILYHEKDYQEVCLRAGFGRPEIFKARSWKEIAFSITYHAENCSYCHENLNRLPELSESECAPKCFAKSHMVPNVRLISSLRQSIGTYTVDWTEKDMHLRPGLILLKQHKSNRMQIQLAKPLLAHPTMACRLAFTEPIQSITCAFEADESWRFVRQPEADWTTAHKYDIDEDLPEGLAYRSNAHNANGLTCYDLLYAASDIPGIPYTDYADCPLTFNGVLDDQIRQGTVWVQALGSSASTPPVALPYDTYHFESSPMDLWQF